ncbi:MULTISPECIES: alpha-amylase family protein [Hungatella]|jgi:amylosucrase|uniref:alpha-amylase family protein n=1 Tax=Hungatella TaxID=1649459 RepID=UPI0006C3A2F8|nr:MULTISPECIES: alpha-amylase family protein [Hungatella]MCD7999033.1 alpha-amylase family protein [Clostridiales bacterium]MCI7381288.1 alpha-amylase family protein [Hungatella sp.]MDY6235962.1 alpha-amylase family protein [Hungatella hathewayi]CUQ30627.1 sucrose phosphorylase [Hungatella hathewayi]
MDYCKEYEARFNQYYDELKWLYCELYKNQDEALEQLCGQMYRFYTERKAALKRMDRERAKNPQWYKGNRMVGMMMYTDAFAGDLKGVLKHLNYIEECGVNYLHLMPLLDTPEGRSDGGYAVSDFRKVRPDLGTMEDLECLAAECHKRDVSICLDFVMNHTSEDHEWARKARMGDPEYQSRYFFYDNYDLPAQFERTVPEVFPTTAPGNFTWVADAGKYVMTTFYPYQWDLNYWNPVVLNEMVGNMLNLVNRGIDVIRIDAVPYIWKQLGTNCRNLPQVHSIVRIMRIICEIVCPGVLLLGEVVMEPDKVVPYFGSVEKPECHMLYNVTTMAATWNSVATKDIRLLRQQMNVVSSLPKDYVFLNYLRCHDDIGWGLDYPWLKQFGIDEVSHKKYLNDFLTGQYPGSFGRGELYNSDPESGDARLCGTTASLCGIEKAAYERDEEALKKAVRLDLMLHAYMLSQSGIPVIYSGDEIGQENDYTYHENPKKWDDSRYLHRGSFRWDLEKKRSVKGSLQETIFEGIKKLESIRAQFPVFCTDAEVWTIDTWDDAVLGLVRRSGEEKLIALFNFSEFDKVAWINEEDGMYKDLISGRRLEAKGVQIPAYGVYWLMREKWDEKDTAVEHGEKSV